MTQNTLATIDPNVLGGNGLAAWLESFKANLYSNHRGNARPGYVVAGMIWPKTISSAAEELYYYDGGGDILLGTFNPTDHTLVALLLKSLNGGATFGPDLLLDRASPSPAVNDILGALRLAMRNASAAQVIAALDTAEILNVTAGAEEARRLFQTMVGGALATRMKLGRGLVIGAPAGDDKGAGALNAEVIYINGTLLEKLAANRTYYVRANGSDSNDGLANTAGGAFLTIQKAWDTIRKLDLNGFNVTVQIADGTYTGGLNASGSPVGCYSPDQIVFQGNSGTPANVIVSVTAPAIGSAFFATNGALITLKDFEVRTITSGQGFYVTSNAILYFTNIRFGVCVSSHMLVISGGKIFATGNYSIVGAASWHWYAQGGGSAIYVASKTITISGTPAFGTYFAQASDLAYMEIYSNTFSGSATGTRYLASRNSVMNTATATLPGSIAGSVNTGGVYS